MYADNEGERGESRLDEVRSLEITATSTEEMSGGAGHQVVYDADLGKFTGYGSPEGE